MVLDRFACISVLLAGKFGLLSSGYAAVKRTKEGRNLNSET